MHVSELAREVGVEPYVVRYYSRIGLLRPHRDPDNGYQRFSRTDLRRLLFVRRAQRIGLTLAEIRDLLDQPQREPGNCRGGIGELLERRLAEIERKLAELAQMKERMSRALAAQRTGSPPPPCTEIPECGLCCLLRSPPA